MAALLERDAELDRLSRLVEGARDGRGAVAAIEGPPGIGKTRLGEETAARAQGLTVLSACGSELEQDFGYGAVRQLFEPAVLDRPELFEGAAALAAPALGLEGDVPPADARFSVIHGLYWLTANLAAETPLLVWVDDLHWVDRPSRRFLAYLSRRVADLPALLLVSLRPPLPGEDRTEAGAIASARDTLLIEPAPLSVEAVATLAERRLGTPPDPGVAAEWRRLTGGNALLVEDLLAEVAETGAVLGDVGIERVARRVNRRLEALPRSAIALAEAVAVLGDGCSLEAAAALAGLASPDAAAGAEALIAADVLVAEPQLRFRHPLVRAAAAERLSAVARAAAHARAARILAERHAPVAAVATHLLAGPPAADPWAVDVLRAAAREDMRQGAPELAARLLQRAVDEPPPAELRVDVLLELGAAERAAGMPAAVDHLREAIALLDDPARRAREALTLAGTLAERLRWREAADVARGALAGLAGRERELQLTLRAVLADCVRMDPAAGGDEPERIRRFAATLRGETPAERLLLATAASITPADTAAAHAEAAELLERSLVLDPHQSSRPETGIVSNFIRAGRLERAEAVVDRMMGEARRRGHVQRHVLMLSMRGWIALERGNLAAADEDLRQALELAQDVEVPTASFGAMLAVVLAERGDPAAAGDTLDAFGVAGPLPETQVMSLVLHLRARVRFLQGRSDDALADALDVGCRYERFGLRRAVPPWRSLAAQLLAERGEREHALALAEEELALAERWDTPLARGLALRGLGLVKPDIELLRAAVEQLEGTPWRLEAARALVDLGAALRRAGRRAESREPLSAGMDLAHACGARTLAEHARTELLAAGARPRRLALSGAGALTPSERRVCQLAAAGRTNRQIAQDLFVTTATVETHLRHAYRKLGLRSRDELAAVLSSG